MSTARAQGGGAARDDAAAVVASTVEPGERSGRPRVHRGGEHRQRFELIDDRASDAARFELIDDRASEAATGRPRYRDTL